MALVGSLSAYLASYLSLQFGLLLLATVFASGRGWGAVPFVILAISECTSAKYSGQATSIAKRRFSVST